MNTKVTFFAGASLIVLGACASNSGDSPLQPRRTVECPPSLMMICETRDGEPSSAGDEEMPQYERCICRPRPI